MFEIIFAVAWSNTEKENHKRQVSKSRISDQLSEI